MRGHRPDPAPAPPARAGRGIRDRRPVRPLGRAARSPRPGVRRAAGPPVPRLPGPRRERRGCRHRLSRRLARGAEHRRRAGREARLRRETDVHDGGGSRGHGRRGGPRRHRPDGRLHEATRARLSVRSGARRRDVRRPLRPGQPPASGQQPAPGRVHGAALRRRVAGSPGSSGGGARARRGRSTGVRRLRAAPAGHPPRLLDDPGQHDPRHRQPARALRSAGSGTQQRDLGRGTRDQHRAGVPGGAAGRLHVGRPPRAVGLPGDA